MIEGISYKEVGSTDTSASRTLTSESKKGGKYLGRIKVMRVFISLFCIVLLLGVLLLVMPTDAQRDEATVAANWSFNDGSAKDTSKKGLDGNFTGKPKAVEGIAGKALQFNGKSDGIKFPDSVDINTGRSLYQPDGRGVILLR